MVIMDGMIEYRTGDIFASGAEFLVIPVNCIGAAGKGLAKSAKDKWPKWERDYKAFCQARMLPGDVVVHQPEVAINPRLVSFASKDHWRNPTKLEWVRLGLETLAGLMCQVQPASIAMPAIGCGNGLLRWVQVRPLIQAAAEKMSAAGIDVYVHGPQGT